MKKKIYSAGIVGLIVFVLLNRLSYLINLSFKETTLTKISDSIDNLLIEIAHKPFFISFRNDDILCGFIGFSIVILCFLYHAFDNKKYMFGKEYGSANFGQPKEISKFLETDFSKNMILTASEFLSLNTRKTRKNNNVLVIGSSGSGKTRFFLKPNLMQCHSSYVITDPKGSIVRECGMLLEKKGYDVKVLDLINMKDSMRYNPFNYIKDEKDILKLVNNLIINTNSNSGKKEKSDFWEKAEIALLSALIGFVFFEGLEKEKNMQMVLELLRTAEVKEDNENYKSPLDIVFEELKAEKPNSFCCKQYDIYKLAAGKTAKSILVSVGVRLSPFNIKEVADLMSEDTLNISSIGDKKTALFIVISDSDNTFNFIAAMLYQQLFDTLFYKADFENKGRLKIPVRFLLDEFANIGLIPNFDIYIATMRSREISVNVILQNLAQLKSIYKDTWENITGNCDTLLFLGGREESTLKYLSTMLGKSTINTKTYSENKGQNGSYTVNNQIIGRELMMPDEIALLDNEECLLMIRGLRPFKSKKYDIEKHENYKYLADYDDKNYYDYSDFSQRVSKASRSKEERYDLDDDIVSIELDEDVAFEVIEELEKIQNTEKIVGGN